MIKLINNSFRDHVFAFANGVALLTDMFNLDANRVIAAANEGYQETEFLALAQEWEDTA